MKTLLLKSLLFALPIPVFALLELFVLPIDMFTFRVWEAAQSVGGGSLDRYLKGPFLPNLHIIKIESGDKQLPHGKTKRVEWFTDAFGHRNRPRKIERFDVVTIGDSHIAGSFLDQRDTLAESLERVCGCLVYNHAYSGPGDMVDYLRQARFAKMPPKLIVFDFRGYDFYDPASRYGFLPDNLQATVHLPDASDRDVKVEIIRRRFQKKMFLNWARARARTAIRYTPYPRVGPRAVSLSQSDLVSKYGSAIVEKFVAYKKAIEARGSRFALLFVDFDNQFEDLIKPLFRDAGLDLLTLPRVKDPYKAYFQEDDSHWKEEGPRAAAGVIFDHMKKQGLLPEAGR